MHPPRQRIPAHRHDWPVLTLYRMGAYREEADGGERAALDGPSIVFQPAGAAHADEIGEEGLETLAMTFDPAWLTQEARHALPRRTCWRPGGSLSAASRRLASVWLSTDEAAIKFETSRFLLAMFAASAPPPRPAWADRVEQALGAEVPTSSIAEELGRHPAWIARAYRAWRGEGMVETVRRRRVEHAVVRLRSATSPLADVAAECGFCDQSHMNRAFRAVLGRTPAEVRREAALLAPLTQSP
jgi:AraC family transcriptional regulator